MGKRIQKNEGLLKRFTAKPYPPLEQTLFGVSFKSPLGLAAGFDKNIELAPLMQALGFGFMEGGSVSARPWLGNPCPRLFRLPEDRAIVNRMGLNNQGIQQILPRLQTLPPGFPVGISLVKTPDPAVLDDFAVAYEAVCGLGAYIALNISCPNTEEGKTFEDPEALDTLLTQLKGQFVLKISPNLSPIQLEEIFEVGLKHQVCGWIATNTMPTPKGGLSGPPLFLRSTEVLGQLYQLCRKQQVNPVLIGVGGVMDAESAWEKIIHGASLVEIYTGLIYKGPNLIKEIHAGLLHKLEDHGLSHIRDAVGLKFL